MLRRVLILLAAGGQLALAAPCDATVSLTEGQAAPCTGYLTSEARLKAATVLQVETVPKLEADLLKLRRDFAAFQRRVKGKLRRICRRSKPAKRTTRIYTRKPVAVGGRLRYYGALSDWSQARLLPSQS